MGPIMSVLHRHSRFMTTAEVTLASRNKEVAALKIANEEIKKNEALKVVRAEARVNSLKAEKEELIRVRTALEEEKKKIFEEMAAMKKLLEEKELKEGHWAKEREALEKRATDAQVLAERKLRADFEAEKLRELTQYQLSVFVPEMAKSVVRGFNKCQREIERNYPASGIDFSKLLRACSDSESEEGGDEGEVQKGDEPIMEDVPGGEAEQFVTKKGPYHAAG